MNSAHFWRRSFGHHTQGLSLIFLFTPLGGQSLRELLMESRREFPGLDNL